MEQLSDFGPWFLGFLPLLLTSALCGLILGYERYRRSAPVGMKVCTLVAVGATTYMASSHLVLEVSGLPGDPTRVAGQIVTGIGFLGAGAIIRGGGGISGLTSAATIWFIGAVGVLVGCRYPLSAVSLTLVVVGLVEGIRRLEEWLEERRGEAPLRVRLRLGEEGARGAVLAALQERDLEPREYRFRADSHGVWLEIRSLEGKEGELMAALWELPEVVEVRKGSGLAGGG